MKAALLIECYEHLRDDVLCRTLSESRRWGENLLLEPTADFPGNGILYLKGGDLEKELRSFPEAKIHSVGEYFTEPFFETKKLIYLPFKSLQQTTGNNSDTFLP